MSQLASRNALIAIGCGPKTVAIAAKAFVLEKLGQRPPSLAILEMSEVGANWAGEFGFTNGEQLLGTPPEKDVGFPYNSTVWGPLNGRVNEMMMTFSWQAYLIDGNWGGFSDWVDRGKPSPPHKEWSSYLKWVTKKVDARPIIAEASKLDLAGERIKITYRKMRGKKRTGAVIGDGLVLTGPGEPTRIPGEPIQHPRCFNSQTFWHNVAKFRRIKKHGRVAIIGSGETAASVAVQLISTTSENVEINIVNPHGSIYSRGESYRENRLFSNPTDWPSMLKRDRINFIQRTDLGVFSQMAMEKLDDARNIQLRSGRVDRMLPVDSLVFLGSKYGAKQQFEAYDYVINTAGANHLWFRRLATKRAQQILGAATRNWNEDYVAQSIGYDLSIRRLKPRFHIPFLARTEQGPGFPNLSCLGLLSDRILFGYK